jgi:membrane peptidoglycan carboxypeptidase
VKLTEEDNSLSLALGASKYGSKLSEITSAYNIFLNQGYYIKPSTVNKIVHNGITIKQNLERAKKVFSNETVSFINETLNYTVKDGTAKKLKDINGDFYAKTGTVGTDKGNTDAYIITYTKDYVLGCWVGCKDKALMSNSTTGGSICASTARDIWTQIYQQKSPDKIPPQLQQSK